MTKAKAAPKKAKTRVLNMRVDGYIIDKFQEMADKQGRSRSNLMKYALKEFIAVHD